jgi:hypothetical protein
MKNVIVIDKVNQWNVSTRLGRVWNSSSVATWTTISCIWENLHPIAGFQCQRTEMRWLILKLWWWSAVRPVLTVQMSDGAAPCDGAMDYIGKQSITQPRIDRIRMLPFAIVPAWLLWLMLFVILFRHAVACISNPNPTQLGMFLFLAIVNMLCYYYCCYYY